MHTTGAPQLTIVELIEALEAKIAAMRAAKDGKPADKAAAWKKLWRPRTNGRQRQERTHPFSNIEEL
jgi:hypothetical protein